MRYSRLVGLIFGLGLCSAGAQASQLVVNHWACEVDEQQGAPRMVPVGCDVVGAALGCPTSSPLQVQLRFKAPPEATAVIKVMNAPATLAPAVGAWAGTAKRMDATTISMRPGMATLSGFVADAASVPRLVIDIDVEESDLQGASSPWLSDSDAAQQIELNVTQVVGNYQVSHTTLTHYYYSCGVRSPWDQITIVNRTPSPPVVALLDAKSETGCMPARGFRGQSAAPLVPLPNLVNKGGCLERVAVFSTDRALAFRKDSAFWKDGLNDDMSVELAKPVRQHIKLWVLYDPCRTPDPDPGVVCLSAAEMEARPTRHLEHATRLYAEQFSGIALQRIRVKDFAERTESWVRGPVDGFEIQCDTLYTQASLDKLLQIVNESPLPIPDGAIEAARAAYGRSLNVFYVKAAAGLGVWCGEHDPDGIGRDTILLSADAELVTLAHEIGHALLDNGGHAEDEPGYSTTAHADNLMRGSPQEALTLGQMFRMSLYENSSLNRQGARATLPKVTCSQAADASNACPGIWSDVRPR